MSIRLIVNADDYGRTPGVSAGIREGHLRGIVTSTTAMMNMPGVEEALHQAIRQCPDLGLGVHLVLTAGRPLLSPGRIPSLTAGTDRFPRPPELIPRLPVLDPAEVQAEWQAQIELFVTTTGRAPDHLDSHHHSSYLTPALFQAMLELARAYDCGIRLPEASGGDAPMEDLPPQLQDLPAIRRLLQEYQPRCPGRFVARFYGASATRDVLLDILAHLPEGATEVMCHPGFADDALLRGSGYGRQRESELAILTDPEVLAEVKARRIELIPFSRL